MTCPKCKTRLKCVASYCKDDITARRYRCKECGYRLHTIENPANKYAVNVILTEGRLRYEK